MPLGQLPPGARGYILGEQLERQKQAQEIGQLAQFLQMQGALQKQQLEQQYRGAIAGAKTPEEQERIAVQFGGPQAVIQHADRRAQIAATTEMGKARLQQAANQLEMTNQFNQQRIGSIQDEAERKRQADAWQKTYQQGQLEIQRGNLEIKQELAKRKMIPGNEPLKAPELLHYIDKEGNHPPVGSSLNQVIEKGYRLATTNEINMLLAGRGAESTVNQLDQYVETLWGKEGEEKITQGLRPRMKAGAGLVVDRLRQDNPDLIAFESFAAGTLSPLIRAIGEKGALSEGDIQRAINLIPKTGNKLGELPDTSVVARQKMKQLRDWFSSALGKSPQGAATTPSAPAGAPQEGQKSKSRSGRPIIFRNGKWEYE